MSPLCPFGSLRFQRGSGSLPSRPRFGTGSVRYTGEIETGRVLDVPFLRSSPRDSPVTGSGGYRSLTRPVHPDAWGPSSGRVVGRSLLFGRDGVAS